MKTLILAACATLALGVGAAQAVPKVVRTSALDLDQGLQFPKNKQNETSIARDPRTGALIAGANDEIRLDLCLGTTAALASPCPFTPGRPTSA